MNILKNKIAFMMTIENIHGREILTQLVNTKFFPSCIIIEHKSERSERIRNLKYNNYEPKKFTEIIKNSSTDIFYVENHNDVVTEKILKKFQPELIILGGTRILKENIIKIPRFGIINSHPAILPKYQGSDCVAWSILNGDLVGATVHFIDSGVDSGPIILQKSLDYHDCKTLGEIRVKVMKLCSNLVLESLNGLKNNTLVAKKQNSSLSIHHKPISVDKLKIVEKIILDKFNEKT